MKNLVLFRLSCLQSKNITSDWEEVRGGKQRNSKDLGDANTKQEEESRKTSEGNRMQDNKETKTETGRQQKEEITRRR